MWNNFKKMPFFLKLIALHGFVFFIAAFVSLLPIPGMFSIDSKTVSYLEWWTTGSGFEFFFASISIGIGAICLLKKAKHARTLYLAAFMLSFLVLFLFEHTRLDSAIILISGLIPLIIIYCYLFHTKSVSQYFNETSLE